MWHPVIRIKQNYLRNNLRVKRDCMDNLRLQFRQFWSSEFYCPSSGFKSGFFSSLSMILVLVKKVGFGQNNKSSETANHLCMACPFTRGVWRMVATWTGVDAAPTASFASVDEWWDASLPHGDKTARRRMSSHLIYV
ncbi:hypothetical protein BRADI_3g35383v3 [Brachypodium distachyon]|uniref:Reverse transcriptase zinc-binding domain-containing protein n=1 Tax=Brachypodium distachyon TaxID=15368 RepID=A0A2K2D1A2_BRADI|nr:hypothetical protein BRADI_3g35383v3 [Brachypodium distachyon]